MNQITNGPNTYDFGYDFNYATWPINTVVDLVNVPWNNDYRDIVKFQDGAALDAYIDSLRPAGIQISELSYLKANEPVRVNIPFNRAIKYNYLRASNPVQPVNDDVQRNFYYFIIDVRYLAPNTTELVLQLDIWQTYGFDVTFGNCYVERGHIGIANNKAMQNYGRDYLTVPEGLDTGGEYVIAWNETIHVSSAAEGVVLVASTVDLLADPGTVTAPTLVTAKGSAFMNMPSGATYYGFSSSASFSNWLVAMQDKPWVTQGIISVTIVPAFDRYGFDSSSVWAPNIPYDLSGYRIPNSISHKVKPNWRASSDLYNGIPQRYRGLKKLYTFPYMAIEMTTWSGTPIIIKPEGWRSNDAEVGELIGYLPPNARAIFYPQGYNANNDNADGSGATYDDGEFLDYYTMMGQFPQVAVVNNMAIGYLAANANSIPYSFHNAEWSQQRALQSNAVGYDQASSGINMANQMAQNQQQANTALLNAAQLQTRIASTSGILGNVGAGAVGGATIGAFGGGPGAAAGAAIGAAGGLVSGIAQGVSALGNLAQQNTNTTVNNALIASQNAADVSNKGFVRDTNKSLADWVAKGDYANEIAGINAKLQDTKLIQPSTSGQIGGESFNWINGHVECKIRWKWIDQSAMTMVGEYWLRYGYAIHKFMTPPKDLMVMQNFTYWKFSETYISAAELPESFKQTIRGIFEKGVTVWDDPTIIGKIDIANNQPLTGVSY